MKPKSNPFFAASLATFVVISQVALAADVIKADNTNNLDLGISWTGGIAPTSTGVALWSGAYNTAGSLSSSFTASTPVSWQGIRIGNISGTAAGQISIGGTGGAVTGSQITIGASGIDMSAANQNLVINAATTVISGNQIWDVATGRNLRFGITGTGSANANLDGSGTITVRGGGVVDLNQGGSLGFSDAAGLAGFSGKWIIDSGTTLRGIRNGATAFGTNTAADAITLNGGTLATGGISGATGNWTWNSNITLATSTSSTIDNQNPSGTNRSLKLMGAITGSGNLTFASTGAGTMSADNGFVLTGSNTNSGTVTINSGAFLRVGGVSTASDTSLAAGTGGTLGNGSVTNNVVNNGTLTFSRSDAHTVANAISGTGTVRVGSTGITGSGTQVLSLSGTNTYVGSTSVNAGRLNLTGSLTSAVTVASGATITGTGSTTGLLTLSAGSSVLLSASGAVTANGVTVGAGVNLVDPTLNTVGAHSFTVVTYGAGAAPTLANFTINGGGAATIRGAGLVNTGTATTLNYTTVANVWNTTSGTWDVATNANWTNGSDSLYYNGDSATFNEPASASTVTLSGALTPASVTVSNTNNAYTFTGGAITGAGGLTKNNDGTLAIASQQTYTGGTTINGGIVDLTGGGGATGTIRGTATVNTGGTLRLSVNDATGYNTDATRLGVINLVGGTLHVNTTANQTLGSAVINLTGGSITGIAGSNIDLFGNGSAINTLASAMTSTISLPTMNLRQDNTAFGVADGAAAVDLLISSNLGNGSTGNHNLIKNGAGTMVLSGTNNTYIGTTTVTAGTLTVSGTTNGTSGVTVNGGASLVVATGGTLTTTGILGTASATGANITVQTGATLNAASANIAWNPGTFQVDGTLAITGNFAVGTNAAGTISGTNGSITAASFSMGNATTTVNFTNTGSMAFTGDMTLAATNSTFNQSAGTISANGILLNSGTSNTFALTGGRLNLGSGGIGGSGGTKTINLGAGTVGARASWSSALAMSLTDSATGTTFNTLDSVDNTTARTISLSGLLSGSGQLVKAAAGTLTLTGPNTYTGGTTIGGGTLGLGSAGALGSSGNVVFAGGTLQFSANNTTDYSARIASGISTGSVSIDTNGQDIAFGTGLTASQSGGLTKTGAGTLTLSVANLYTGPTNVNDGMLRVNGSFASTTTTVASGATLGGTGTLAGTTTIQNGGIHGPGNSPGVQGFSNLTYNDGSIFSWEIDRNLDQSPTGRGIGYDAVNVSGTLAGQDGTADSAIFRVVIGDANFANDFWTSSHTWSDIFTSDGSNAIANWTSIFGGGIQTYTTNGGLQTVDPSVYGSFSFTPGTNSLTWSAVPEPTSALAGILLGFGLLRRNRATRFFRG